MKFFAFFFLLVTEGFALHAQSAAPGDTAFGKRAGSTPDSVFTIVEYESDFPGGQAAWIRFLNTHLEYPRKAVRKNIQGMVLLQFIVDKEGVVSDIEAVSGPDLLKEAAINVIKESPRWVPAIKNGRKVKSYKKQPITFRIQ